MQLFEELLGSPAECAIEFDGWRVSGDGGLFLRLVGWNFRFENLSLFNVTH